MPSHKSRPSVKNQREISTLIPEKKEYRATVEGVDCLYVKVSPNGDKKYVTSVTVSKRLQLPAGQSRQKSKTHGLTGQFTLSEIKQLHYKYYQSFKQGEDPREDQIKDKSELERTSLLNRPIVSLGRERIKRMLQRGDLTKNAAYLDELYTKKVENVIGKVSFQEFGQHHADALARAYPVELHWSTADKVKKLVIKVYNDLPSDARISLLKDIPHYLNKAFGNIKQRKRSDQLIEPDCVGEAWKRMLEADVNPIFKDAWVLILLTGERREAIFKAKRQNLLYDEDTPEYLYLNSKGDRDGTGGNLYATFGVLAMLLDRLAKDSDQLGSPYLFPSQKGKGALTSIKPLVDALGGFGPHAKRATPHNIRRTVANLAREVLGSTAIAEEHILHSKVHMTGSTENYFSETSKAFAQARKQSYQQTYRYLDELILCAATIGHLDRGADPFVDAREDTLGQGFLCRNYISLENRAYMITRGDRANTMSIFKDHIDFCESAKVWSPVASFCAAEDKFVLVKKRPLSLAKLENEWANYGEKRKRNLDEEIG